jgi:formate dehydrogenase beta subunit
MVKLTIDEVEVSVPKGTTILDAAQQAEIYIPHLCSHPDLPRVEQLKPAEAVYRGSRRIENKKPEMQYEGCQLCVVQVKGKKEPQRACSTEVEKGMVVSTDTPELQEYRRDKLMSLLAKHPHACLTCAQKEGCTRSPCSMNIPEKERCCSLFGNCEFQRIVEYVGIKKETPRYVFEDLPVIKEPLFEWDYNLCIGCTRCIRACRDLRGIEAIDFVFDEDGRVMVGSVGPTLRESACRFCAACVEVCPTGALLYKGPYDKVPHAKAYLARIDIPHYTKLKKMEFTAENVSQVPETEGVYQLLDREKNIIYIKGSMNLHRELEGQLTANQNARYFMYEEEPMYTKRESELLQQYTSQHGQMPEGNRELEDLF